MLRNYGSNRPGQKNHDVQLDKHGQPTVYKANAKPLSGDILAGCLILSLKLRKQFARFMVPTESRTERGKKANPKEGSAVKIGRQDVLMCRRPRENPMVDLDLQSLFQWAAGAIKLESTRAWCTEQE
ncbi:unnamed protein product [Fusarium venenatum]|uniref:Uncharacterized protein n=1 Tax=Fusarium venenatum TaxID=56646 RepID=A0A2L2TRS2_9HYPO|nr:uncharacterized protein FVRRES_08888 [Fusarium venenatum]CEI68811.1 unnamed protein product [Fusarium venenatum]